MTTKVKFLLHPFLECEVSRGLWIDIAKFLAILCNFKIEISDGNIILWIVRTRDSNKFKNVMNIEIKYYIYARRCKNKQSTVPSAIGKIKDMRKIEHSIAIKIILWTDIIEYGSCWNLCWNCALMSHDFIISALQMYYHCGCGCPSFWRKWDVGKHRPVGKMWTNVCNSHPDFYISQHLAYKK